MTTISVTKDFNSFLSDLKSDKDFFNKIGPILALLIPGNWSGLINLASSFGYIISPNEILQFITKNPAIEASLRNNAKLLNWVNIDPLKALDSSFKDEQI